MQVSIDNPSQMESGFYRNKLELFARQILTCIANTIGLYRKQRITTKILK
ncbi:MAG: hypothetical protein HNEKOMLI_00474 [Sodalis sp. Psp]|nr:hypothetical protein [Sodalis sp. Psp]MCR3756947.1 hypothetical protein [Sodalis sp. Ppy]